VLLGLGHEFTDFLNLLEIVSQCKIKNDIKIANIPVVDKKHLKDTHVLLNFEIILLGN